MPQTERIELGRVLRAANLAENSFDEAANTVDVIWSTGASVARYDYRSGRPYNEVLSMDPDAVRLDRLNVGAPFLNTHNDMSLGQVLGSVVPGSARIDGGRGLAKIQLTRRADAAGVVQDIRDGVIRNISVGYRLHRVDKMDMGEDMPMTWNVVDWEPMEISAVPVPADAGAQVRGEKPGEVFPCVFTRSGRSANAAIAARMRMRARLGGVA